MAVARYVMRIAASAIQWSWPRVVYDDRAGRRTASSAHDVDYVATTGEGESAAASIPAISTR